jgi:hypothetical protein
VGGNSLTITIAGGLTMNVGSFISGDVNTASGIGANITINASGDVLLYGNGTGGARITSNEGAGSCSGGKSGNITIIAGGNIATQDGSVISAGDLSKSLGNGFGPHCPGGAIVLTAGNGSIDVDGKVLSQSSLTGTGAVQRPGGGPITITAGCDLTVSNTGIVSSRGLDPGADLVSLTGGCSVLIDGLVESTGPGHAVPNSPPNHCATGVYAGNKPSNSTACIQILSGGALTIDSTPPHTGEVNADTAQAGGHQIAWIDVFAAFGVAILGDSSGPYAIHANEFVSNSDGGLITVKSKFGAVTTSGLAIQANGAFGQAGGGLGGSVDVEALNNVAFGANTSVQAKGDTTGGGHQGGGTILAHAWGAGSDVTGVASANLDAGGGPPPGSVNLRACDAVNYLGSSTPAFVPSTGAGECGAVPFPGYISFPSCACELPCIRS